MLRLFGHPHDRQPEAVLPRFGEVFPVVRRLNLNLRQQASGFFVREVSCNLIVDGEFSLPRISVCFSGQRLPVQSLKHNQHVVKWNLW